MKGFSSFYIVISVLAVICSVSCARDSFQAEFPQDAVVLDPVSGSSASINCVFPYEWSVSVLPSGYTVDPSSGPAGKAELEIVASDTNTGVKERESVLVLLSGDVSAEILIIQRAEPGLFMDTDSFAVPDGSGRIGIQVSANVPVTAETKSSWLEIESVSHGDPVLLSDGKTLSDSLSYTVMVSYSGNDSNEERTGTISVSAGGESRDITIVQQVPMTVDWNREFYRTVPVLRFTATWCYNCPLMSEAVAAVEQSRPGRVVPISMHAVSSEGGLAYYRSGDFEQLYDIPGYPTGVVSNVASFQNERPVENEIKTLDAMVAEVLESYPPVTALQVSSSISGDNVTLTADIAAKEAGEYRIMVFLLESNMVFPQQGDEKDYVHDDVVREVLSDELFGDTVTAEADAVVKYSVTKKIPRSVTNRDNLSLVVIVCRPGVPDVKGVEKATYLETGYIWDNAVSLSVNGFAPLRYED